MALFRTQTAGDHVRVVIQNENATVDFETDTATARRLAEELTKAAEHIDQRKGWAR